MADDQDCQKQQAQQDHQHGMHDLIQDHETSSDPADLPATAMSADGEPAVDDSDVPSETSENTEPSENTEENSQAATELATAGTDTSPRSEPTDDTSEIPGKQPKAKPPRPPVPAALTLVERIDQRLRYIEGILSEKEQLQMSYVFHKIPRPYYVKWKDEGNELLMLAVNLRLRKAVLLKKQKAS